MTNPRRDVILDLDPARVPSNWCSRDEFATTFMNAMSLLFPEGERFFIESVKQLKHVVTDPQLAEDVAGFIGQEAMHGREHRVFHEVLVAHGYTSAPEIEARLRRLAELGRRRLSHETQLAITCALEHFTAMFAEQILSSERLRDQFDPTVRPLWVWHSLEESEHKSVAFDVYRAAGGGYLRRVTGMLLATGILFLGHSVALTRLLSERGLPVRLSSWRRGLGKMKGWDLRGLGAAYLTYFRPSFHPNDRDHRALVMRWRDQLFGPDGALRANLRATA